MNNCKITTIAGIKVPPSFRNKRTVGKHLRSLVNQDYPNERILVDFGSDKESLKWIREITKETKTRLVEVTRDTEVWNESRVINIGIKASRTKYVLLTGADMIFEENLIGEVVRVLKKKKAVVRCRQTDLNADGTILKRYHSKSAMGSCMGFNRDWLMKVHGYDENFKGWGLQDCDLFLRAQADGLPVEWVQGRTEIYHQWHPEASKKDIKANIAYINKFEHGRPVIRNLGKWGEL